MGIRDALKRAAGLLVDFPIEEGDMPQMSAKPATGTVPKTVEQIVKESPGPNLDEVKVNLDVSPPKVTPDGSINFDDIYRRASLPECAFSVEQALELISSLPADVNISARRHMVRVSLATIGKSIGATSETIVADASRKMAALASYCEAMSTKTDQYVAQAELQIASLQNQVGDLRKEIESTKNLMARLNDVCVKESDRLDDVLEFFSLDVAPSKHAETSEKHA